MYQLANCLNTNPLPLTLCETCKVCLKPKHDVDQRLPQRLLDLKAYIDRFPDPSRVALIVSALQD